MPIINPSTTKAQAGEPEVQGPPWQHSESGSLSYIREALCQTTVETCLAFLLVEHLLKSHESFHTQSILLGFRLCHSCPACLSPSYMCTGTPAGSGQAPSVLPSCPHCPCFFGFCRGLSPCGCSLASTVPSSDPSKSGSTCVPHRSLFGRKGFFSLHPPAD